MKKEIYKTHSFKLSVEKFFLQSKTGKKEDCEDTIYIDDHFIAVIDGATSKTGERWNKRTGGQIVADIILQAFSKMPYNYDASQATTMMTNMVVDFYKNSGIFEIVKTDHTRRISASFVAISLFREEIWSVGDCQFFLGNQKFTKQKKVDQILSNARALSLELELLKGATIEQLRQNDIGRKFIMPLLKEQALLQNNLAAKEYGYIEVNGFPIPYEGIIIETIPSDTSEIILATDGYPDLQNNFEKSERILQDVLAIDPLLFRKYKSTKGVISGNISFDDRAFVKIKLEKLP